jgi:hypothetical protein
MNINELKESKYLRKEDFPGPALATIRSFQKANVAPENKPPQQKWIMFFDEYEKGLVLGSTNAQLAAKALGSDETDDWIGQQIVLYNDPNVTYGSEVTGGIRLRAPKRKTAAPPPAVVRSTPQAPADFDEDSDIPF